VGSTLFCMRHSLFLEKYYIYINYSFSMGHKSAVPAKPKEGDRSTLTPAQKKGALVLTTRLAYRCGNVATTRVRDTNHTHPSPNRHRNRR
jgi:hypothetical protein